MRKTTTYLLILMSVLSFSCNKESFEKTMNDEHSDVIDFFEFENEEWNFIFEGRQEQFYERSRLYRSFKVLNDSVIDIVITQDITITFKARCKEVLISDSNLVFRADSVFMWKSTNKTYIFYDSITKTVNLIQSISFRPDITPICSYGLELGDSFCDQTKIVQQDVLWINGKPHKRIQTSKGYEVIDGISISNLCSLFEGIGPFGDFRCISATYKNEFMEYDFMHR